MKKYFASVVMALALVGCANSALTVDQAPPAFRSATAMLQPGTSTVAVDTDNTAYTQRKLEDAFFGGSAPVFAKGDGLKMRWRYIGFNEGSRFGRYLTAGLAGGSKVSLEVTFLRPDDTVLTTVRGEGTVSGGLFGGSNKTGIDKAVKKIRDYAAANFKG